MSTSLTTRPHFSHNSSVINRLLSNYAKARDQLSAKTSIRHNLRFIRSKYYLLNFAVNVRVSFDNVRRPNKPHSASFFTQGTMLPAIKSAAMTRLRNNLKTNQRFKSNCTNNINQYSTIQAIFTRPGLHIRGELQPQINLKLS